jgi:hypothetical protein
MSSMRLNRDTLLDGLFAFIVAAVLSVLFFGDQLPISALGAKLPEPKVVAYFLSWHVTARGSGLEQSSTRDDAQFTGAGVATETSTVRYIVDAAGSAVTRFRQYQDGGRLSFHDTRYLTFTERLNWDAWQRKNTASGWDCTHHISHTIADPGSYAGYRAVNGQTFGGLLTSSPEQRNGATVIPRPFALLAIGLRPDPILDHIQNDSYGHIAHFNDQGQFTNFGSCSEAYEPSSSVGLGSGLFHLDDGDPRLDLQADPNDSSSFAVHARYSIETGGIFTQTMKVEVDWTAHANLMGKCAERDGPIPEGDPIIHNEDVSIDADPLEVTAAPPVNSDKGISHLTITVTCDQVPIQNAKVELKVEAQDKSGGHNHSDENRPRGKLNGKNVPKGWTDIADKTDAEGKVKVKFESPLTGNVDHARYGSYNIGIGGIYVITAKSKSTRFPNSSPPLSVTTKVDGLQPMKPGASYVLVRVPGTHPEGFHATQGTSRAFSNLANDFQHFQEVHDAALKSCGKDPWGSHALSINDIALPTGGIFDLGSNWGPLPGHGTHNKGEGGDFNRFLDVPDNLTKSECYGTSPVRAWLLHMLLGLGQPAYGKWDCTDLGHPPGCAQGDYNDSQSTIPQGLRLHLHVED